MHEPVLLQEAVEKLVVNRDGFYVDGTFGRGGHSRVILQHLSKQGRLLVIDKDPAAIAVANELTQQDVRVKVATGSFASIKTFVQQPECSGQVNGILLDLGVSSPQLDDKERGFSFLHDGPLDMRMNPDSGESAADWIACADEQAIISVLQEYGEEKFARRIARAILKARDEAPIITTGRLASIVAAANPAWEKHKHPATRTFQAIRIHINNELADLEQGLANGLDVLAVGGRLVVISFHSLEDRIVKRFMRNQARGAVFPLSVPVRDERSGRRLRLVGKALQPSAQEVALNPRARSAVMRVAEKLL